jgi:hypothetical protein
MGFVESEMTNLREIHKTLDATVVRFRVATDDRNESKRRGIEIFGNQPENSTFLG